MTASKATAKSRCCCKKSRCRALALTVAIGFGVAVGIKEWRLPADQRTCHGFVAGVVPYDFRFPTLESIKAKLWDPSGPALNPHIFGIGWTVNVGRLVADAKGLLDRQW